VYLIDVWFVWLQERIPKRHIFERNMISCSNHDNHNKLNSQDIWVGVYVCGGGIDDHLRSTRIFTFIMIRCLCEL
jgi:hypothetical protein